jgi:hypothetical protein
LLKPEGKMESVPARATPRADASISRQLAEQTERQGWVHHVADADSGKLVTKALRRPVAPLSRVERLSRLGHQFDPSIFGQPSHRLTPRTPYQVTPTGWLSLYKANITMPDGEDRAFWSFPSDLVASSDPPGLRAHFEQPPQGHLVVTLLLTGYSWAGQVGHALIQVFYGGPAPASIRIPLVAEYAEHTVDITLSPIQGQLIEVWVTLEPGLHIFTFSAITLARQLVVDPGTF